MISISVVNRFYPPDKAVTGVSAQELVEFLRRQIPGARVRVHATRARYAGGQQRAANEDGIHRLSSWYDGKRKVLRLLASLVEGFRLARAATRNTDVVISLTDPPLLGLWIGLMRRFRRFVWIDWTMDLYPEAFAAAGLVEKSNPIYRWIHRLTSRWSPDLYISLGPRQHEFLQETRGNTVQAFILPCGIVDPSAVPAPEWRRRFSQHVVLAYAGNLGEAHDESLLIELVRRADPERFRFLIAIYGAKADNTRSQLKGFDHVLWRDSIPQSELAHADVHLACLKPEWAHVCVPSKAVSSICLGKPILYWGAVDSDSAVLLKPAGWIVPVDSNGVFSAHLLDETFSQIGDATILAGKTASADRLRGVLQNLQERAYADLAAWIRSKFRLGLSAQDESCR